ALGRERDHVGLAVHVDLALKHLVEFGSHYFLSRANPARRTIVTANRRRAAGGHARPRLFEQPLGLQCLDDVGTGADTLMETLQLRPAAEVNGHVRAPAEYDVQVGIRDREVLAHEEGARAHGLLEVVETAA